MSTPSWLVIAGTQIKSTDAESTLKPENELLGISDNTEESHEDQIRIRRKRLSRVDHAQAYRRIRRDMIRYVYLAIDLSESMHEKDSALGASDGGIRRTRLDIMLDLLQDFIVEYFNQNPLSHLGLVICKNGEAQILCPLSGNKRSVLASLAVIRDGILSGSGRSKNDAGVFSLQNGLRIAGLSLGFMPEYGSREIIVFVAALSTCDPGDLLVETMPELKKARIRVSCIALSAEIYVCKKICENTGGIMSVSLDGRHLRDLVMGLVCPPPILVDVNKKHEPYEPTCEFIHMGFPVRETDDVATLMHSFSASGGRDSKLLFARTGYLCPQCKTKTTDLPVDCAVCGLKLVLAPHLARSFHHLFPVSPFEELKVESVISTIEYGTKIQLTPRITSSTLLIDQIPSRLGFSDGTAVWEVDITPALLISSQDFDRCCSSCLKPIGLTIIQDKKKKWKSADLGNNVGCSLRFQCQDCKNVFCADCDAFIHETLHNCPGCLSLISVQ
jgi:transcription initiation factor TFIIH subunit 2